MDGPGLPARDLGGRFARRTPGPGRGVARGRPAVFGARMPQRRLSYPRIAALRRIGRGAAGPAVPFFRTWCRGQAAAVWCRVACPARRCLTPRLVSTDASGARCGNTGPQYSPAVRGPGPRRVRSRGVRGRHSRRLSAAGRRRLRRNRCGRGPQRLPCAPAAPAPGSPSSCQHRMMVGHVPGALREVRSLGVHERNSLFRPGASPRSRVP